MPETLEEAIGLRSGGAVWRHTVCWPHIELHYIFCNCNTGRKHLYLQHNELYNVLLSASSQRITDLNVYSQWCES